MGASLSDKAIAIFAFAAYHQLTSGGTVTDVVLADGAGHVADPQGVEELTDAGLATVDAERAAFTPKGQTHLAAVVEALRRLAAPGPAD